MSIFPDWLEAEQASGEPLLLSGIDVSVQDDTPSITVDCGAIEISVVNTAIQVEVLEC